MNDLRATFGDYVRVFAGVPKQGTQSLQIFTPHFATIASSRWRCSKGLMDDAGKQGYLFDNAWMTESCGV
jgi:hypothetical protein